MTADDRAIARLLDRRQRLVEHIRGKLDSITSQIEQAQLRSRAVTADGLTAIKAIDEQMAHIRATPRYLRPKRAYVRSEGQLAQADQRRRDDEMLHKQISDAQAEADRKLWGTPQP